MAAPRALLHLPIYGAACTGLYAGSLALMAMLQAQHNAAVVLDESALIDAVTPDLYQRVDKHPPKRKASERVDRVLLHPFGGFAVFLVLMLIVFQALFS